MLAWLVSRINLRDRWNESLSFRTYARNGILLTLMGLTMMYSIVEHAGVNQYVAQAIVVPVIMFVVSFGVHRHNTFAMNEVQLVSGGRRYLVVRVVGMGVARFGFFVLVAIFGTPYLIASALITTALGLPTYFANSRWAFKKS